MAVGRKSGKLVGLDTSTRMAMNAVFAPDREHTGDRQPQPFSQAEELKSTLALKPFRLQFISLARDRGPSTVTEREIHASDASGAIVAAAKMAMSPRTVGLRILDSEGHEVFIWRAAPSESPRSKRPLRARRVAPGETLDRSWASEPKTINWKIQSFIRHLSDIGAFYGRISLGLFVS